VPAARLRACVPLVLAQAHTLATELHAASAAAAARRRRCRASPQRRAMSGVGSKRPRAAATKPVAGREGFTALPGKEGASTHFVRRPFAHSAASALFRDLKAASTESPWKQQTLTVTGSRVRMHVRMPRRARVLATHR
jgi:hypothetical protein